ncbi:iron uptake system component EfeO [Rhodoblastus sphagnicola]|uniref:cupredoxin domain-containing protein n=1 Tax=Rhodoblastus sphagnicola TaxID=333368 RepID=UPI001472E562|nr:cupredoxin domain-containing protein [Rhodoblastus sphagnicola]MBB4199315.1 iron uptake system component EfeO [Rhodoblastus sphagnicola]
MRTLFSHVAFIVFASLAAQGAQAADVPTLPIAVTAQGCEPMALTAPAGKVTFVIANKSTRALEWEILQGVMIIDERENIAPGFKAKLTTKLEPGVYDITCGLLDNPRGKLTVTGATAAITPGDLTGPVAEYRFGAAQVLSDLETALGRLKAAGANREAARKAFVEVRAAALALAPIWAEAGATAGPLRTDLEDADRLLFGDGAAEAAPILDKLDKDARAFAAAVRPLVTPADRLVAGALALARGLPAKIEASASPSALSALEAERAAVERVIVLFNPLWMRVNAPAAGAASLALARLKSELTGAGAQTLETRRAAATELAERLAGLPADLGL